MLFLKTVLAVVVGRRRAVKQNLTREATVAHGRVARLRTARIPRVQGHGRRRFPAVMDHQVSWIAEG